jgi:pyridoxine 5-phosphate synthase
MTKLSVNVNKLATIRNARGKNMPDVVAFSKAIVDFGAHGITVHPRPDGRHIRVDDAFAIAKAIDVEFNIEGYPTKDFLELVTLIKPAQCTLVPDKPEVLTSNAGWAIADNIELLKTCIATLHEAGVRTSLFIDPYSLTKDDLALLPATKTDRVELYTEAYADAFGSIEQARVLDVYQQTAKAIHALGIQLNAGHDLNLENLATFLQAIPMIEEVSIGHALICDALSLGMEETVRRYVGIVDGVAR